MPPWAMSKLGSKNKSRKIRFITVFFNSCESKNKNSRTEIHSMRLLQFYELAFAKLN